MTISRNDRLAGKVLAAAIRSEFLRAIVSSRQDGGRRLALGGTPVRPLTPAEVSRLERQGNSADDWSKVLVAKAPEKPVANTVTVTVHYTWFPELYLVGPITLTSTSTMPMSY